jgi:DNA-binding MarR family transcriptional regulator
MQKHERMIHLIENLKGLGIRSAPLSNIDLSLSQFSLLVCIARMPGCHANDVADKLGLSAPTVSVALRKLEEGIWIEKEGDPNDKRASHLRLTSKSMQIIKSMREHRKSKIKQFMGALDEHEQEMLLGLLEKASHQIEIQK